MLRWILYFMGELAFSDQRLDVWVASAERVDRLRLVSVVPMHLGLYFVVDALESHHLRDIVIEVVQPVREWRVRGLSRKDVDYGLDQRADAHGGE